MRVLSRRVFMRVAAAVTAAVVCLVGPTAAAADRKPAWEVYEPNGRLLLDISGGDDGGMWRFNARELRGRPEFPGDNAVIADVDVRWPAAPGGGTPISISLEDADGTAPYRLVRTSDGATTWFFGRVRIVGTRTSVQVSCTRIIDEHDPNEAWLLTTDSDPARVLAWVWGCAGDMDVRTMYRREELRARAILGRAMVVVDKDALQETVGGKQCFSDDHDQMRYLFGYEFDDQPTLRLTHRVTGRTFAFRGVRRVFHVMCWPGMRPTKLDEFEIVYDGNHLVSYGAGG